MIADLSSLADPGPLPARLTALAPALAAPPPELDRRVVAVALRSAALGIPRRFYVFLPPTYTRQPAQRYPTLYLLRGHEREWVNPAQDSSRRGTVVDVYLRLLAAGRVGPMILIFPGLTSDDEGVHGMATDFHAPRLAPRTARIGTGRFQTYLLAELIPLVDALFRTLPERRHRAVDGFSLGGFMALKVAAAYPDLIVSAGAYDGTFLYADRHGERIRHTDRVFAMPLFDPVFGCPRDHAYAAANNPANIILRSRPASLRRTQWIVRYGREDLEPWGSNYYRGAYLRGLLEERGIICPLPAVLPVGQHDWATADRYMEENLPLHWQAIRPAPHN